MKYIFIALFLFALAPHVMATRFYHPPISRVEITFESGDRVILATEFNTASLKGLTIVSRKGIEYSVPKSAIDGVKAPRLDTMRITFHENSANLYKEGSFQLSFSHGANTANSLESPDTEIFFEDGKYIGGVKEMMAYVKETAEKEKAAEPGATDNPDDAQRLREDH